MRSRERFSPAQARAARALLGWSVDQVAAASRLEAEAIEIYEAGEAELGEVQLALLGYAFACAGVIAKAGTHLAGEGVRRSAPLVSLSAPASCDRLLLP